jgi:hypothetical protein
METLTEKKQMKYYRPNSTPHICPVCKIDFFGRKNSIYCSPECKISLNNENAANRKERVAEQILMLQKNAEILAHFYDEKLAPVEVDKDELLKKGFYEKGPYIRLILKDQGELYQIGNYVIESKLGTKTITIMKLNDLKSK